MRPLVGGRRGPPHRSPTGNQENYVTTDLHDRPPTVDELRDAGHLPPELPHEVTRLDDLERRLAVVERLLRL